MESHGSSQFDPTMIHRVQNLLGGILQGDYLSDGIGHKRLRKLAATPKKTTPTVQPTAQGNAFEAAADESFDPEHETAYEQSADATHGIDNPNGDDTEPYRSESAPSTGRNTQRYAQRATQLTSPEEYQLVRAARAGSVSARDKLVQHHLGLVVMIARRYALANTMPLDDLVAEGNFGLFEAIKRFDPEYGYRFSTYAKWWIRQCVENAIMSQSRVVRLPAHVNREIRKAKSLGEQSVNSAVYLVTNASLNEPSYPEQEAMALLDSLPANPESMPDSCMERDEQAACLLRALESLSEEDKVVLIARFGLDNDEPSTLGEVAKKLGRSAERIRQIQERALLRLKEALLAVGLFDACEES